MRHSFFLFLFLSFPVWAQSTPGNRLAYLDEVDLYYPSRTFPKLITPQWVGDPGVEAVVVLAIDDMRDPQKYETFLRPILRRLKEIDGRAPVSIMTNRIEPADPHLQSWLKEGLSLECHTYDHPCPFFKNGFEKAQETYEKCVDLMSAIPGSKPVAFRMPCCDSLNTPSPRFFAEIFNKVTPQGNFLTIDSSVFNLFTKDDKELPRELVLNPDGTERFRRYLPVDRSFVNYIEDYPYPYVIGGSCWQFPCVVPSDWEAQHQQKPNNPRTVADLKAVLDCTVLKKGVFCLVFHPHNWIKNDQVVELIDHAVSKHGKKVKFLTFKEAQERLDKNLLNSQPLRHAKNGGDNGVRVVDLNHDGYLDVVVGNETRNQTRLWQPERQEWTSSDFPTKLALSSIRGERQHSMEARFGVVRKDAQASVFLAEAGTVYGWHFHQGRWNPDPQLGEKLNQVFDFFQPFHSWRFRLCDLDHDGQCELIRTHKGQQAIYSWSEKKEKWEKLSFSPPPEAVLTGLQGKETGARLVDLDQDGRLDILFSNEKSLGIYLFRDLEKGWSRKILSGKPGDANALPLISKNGTNNGFFIHSGHLWWSNEDTALLKDHVDRRALRDLLKGGNTEK